MRTLRWLIVVAAVAIAAAAPAEPPRVVEAAAPLLQQISSDPYTNTNSQHATQVEPDTFAWGDTVVAAFQSGRYVEGGASNIGWATSKDGGVTWHHGFLPSLTVYSSPPGPFPAASDPSVAYDAAHGVWLINSLTIFPGLGLVVSRSRDGIGWSAPVTVAPQGAHDKNWIVCDNGPGSPYRGRCYVSWDDFEGAFMYTSRSLDGGLTWSAPVAVASSAGFVIGVQPVVQPDGTLIVPAIGAGMVAFRSTNGGVSFGPEAPITGIAWYDTPFLRAGALPSAEVDRNGRVYVAWSDCRFRASCAGNDIVYSTSDDGLAWSAVKRVPIDPVTSGADHFIPGLAVDTRPAQGQANIALAFYYHSNVFCSFETCELNAGYITSNDGGDTWSAAKKLNAAPMRLGWLPDTSSGRMLGDYISTSFVRGAAVAVLPLATAPDASGFHQPTYAYREETDVDGDGVGDAADNCPLAPNAGQQDGDADALGDACEAAYGTGVATADSDGDGCADGREVRLVTFMPQQGGDRDPLSPWDFFDAPVPALTAANPGGTRNRVVSLQDVLAVLYYVGTVDGGGPNPSGVDYDSDVNANAIEDGREYDRTPSALAAKPWRSGAPGGGVTLQDALVALAQVGHSCQ